MALMDSTNQVSNGPNEPNGSNGPIGPNGPDGPNGPNGPRGPHESDEPSEPNGPNLKQQPKQPGPNTTKPGTYVWRVVHGGGCLGVRGEGTGSLVFARVFQGLWCGLLIRPEPLSLDPCGPARTAGTPGGGSSGHQDSLGVCFGLSKEKSEQHH